MRKPPAESMYCGLWPRGAGTATLVKRVGVLTAAEEQPRVVGRLPVRLVAERRPERHADGDQPVEVVRRTLAVGVHAFVVHAGPESGPEERRHVLRRVLEATGPLEGRAAPEVDEAAGVGRRPSGSGAPFDGQHVGSRLARRRPPPTCLHCPGPRRPRRPSRRSEPRRPPAPGSAPSRSSCVSQWWILRCWHLPDTHPRRPGEDDRTRSRSRDDGRSAVSGVYSALCTLSAAHDRRGTVALPAVAASPVAR